MTSKTITTIALRFAENFAPKEGTIKAHEQIIDVFGFVWYGKLGTPISEKMSNEILSLDKPKILLIQSGKADRYWAYVEEIKRDCPELKYIPEYYRYNNSNFKSWFKIVMFEKANNNVMRNCVVKSSKKPLSEASKYSMSPYFIIEYTNESFGGCKDELE